jgi:hypothetical protein
MRFIGTAPVLHDGLVLMLNAVPIKPSALCGPPHNKGHIDRRSLEVLRKLLEAEKVSNSRVLASTTFPATQCKAPFGGRQERRQEHQDHGHEDQDRQERPGRVNHHQDQDNPAQQWCLTLQRG